MTAAGDGGRRRHLPTALAGLAVAALLVLEWRFAYEPGGIVRARWRLFAELAAWWAGFVVAATAVVRLPRRRALPLVGAATLAGHLLGVLHPPQLSDDLYRYVWDGRVQAAGIDPYRYPPRDPHLVPLRDPWLWPDDATCADLDRPPGCTRINRAGERTIYPPLAEAAFVVVHVLSPAGSRDGPVKTAAALLDLALVALLAAGLHRGGRDPRLVAWYALSPLAVTESALDGHVDALGALAALAALLALRRGRAGWGGGLVAAAALVKLYPGLLVVPALRRRPLRAALAAAAVAVVAYLPHVVAVGPRVLGYLPGYLAEEKYDSGGRFLLLGLTGLRGTALTVTAAGLFVVAALWVLRDRAAPVEVAALRLLGAAWLLATPVQPWYGVLLAVVAVLAARPEWLAVAFAAYPLYFAAVLDADTTVVGRVSYGLASMVVLGAVLRRRARATAAAYSSADPSSSTPLTASQRGR